MATVNIFGPSLGGGFGGATSILRAEASDSFLVIPNGDFVLEAGYERLGLDLLRYFPDSIRIVANRRRTRPPMEGISLCGHSAAPI